MQRILVLNGPNLNLLGKRQPNIYGKLTLDDIEANCAEIAKTLGITVKFTQSNHEGELIDRIQTASENFDGIILNAGAFTHTSVAIMDAIGSVETPVLELHLSNIHKREEFRHNSFVAKVAIGMICGLGANGYPLALQAMRDYLQAQNQG
ncbi:MAG: type II 3-dehydroquinate dehydratase [Rhodobacteraceae bacterium]|nr:type II 3-dehydroquinate dehydratase [Paracoccaceae bacterium]